MLRQPAVPCLSSGAFQSSVDKAAVLDIAAEYREPSQQQAHKAPVYRGLVMTAAFVAGFQLPFKHGLGRKQVRCRAEPTWTAPPATPDDLMEAVRISVQNALIAGLRGLRVDAGSDPAITDTPRDEWPIRVAAHAAAGLGGLFTEEGKLLVVSGLSADPGFIKAQFSEIVMSIPAKQLQVVGLMDEGPESGSLLVPEDAEAVLLIAPQNTPEVSVTGRVRSLVRSALGRRIVVVNQALDTVVGYSDQRRAAKRIGMLPVELERFKHVFYWQIYRIQERGASDDSNTAELRLVIHRRYPEPFAVFDFDSLDRVSRLAQLLGDNPPSTQKLITIAKSLLDSRNRPR